MNLNFQQRLVLSFLVIFALFAAAIVLFDQGRIRRYKTEALQERLDAYAGEVSQYLLFRGGAPMDSLLRLMPSDIRLTLVERSGRVLYDNVVPDPDAMENHAERPEIRSAVRTGSGTFIRTSASNDRAYLYYAKDYGGSLIIRVALPYNIRLQSFLKPDNAFLYFIVGLFLIGLYFIYYTGRYFGRTVRHLRNFAASLDSTQNEVQAPKFPDNEFGEVAGRLAENFNRITANEKHLVQEREKLLLHIRTLAEGVCFFNPDRSVAFSNGLFVQYFNVLFDDMISVVRFPDVEKFLDDRGGDDYYETRLTGNGKEFLLRLNIFEDSSFEIILTDVTAQERNRRMKQELTGNVAHELRTPVTSIRGFLEILLHNDLGEAKAHEYLERAYFQTKTLSELISDMSLLTRLDGKQDAFVFSEVDAAQLLERVRIDMAAALSEKNIAFVVDIPPGLTLRGNESLLYSVFRNLTDNVTAHAGNDIEIRIKASSLRDGMVQFSFADTGAGIADQRHLNRLFERFYRVNEGRTRDTGGSGLGLSIVKNTIQFHGGAISVRNNLPTGLEFIFTLPEK
ncbi:MAG: two-component sensor histidine kinase [Culturomica sp.]|jgi:signal transduction histidine kinase|nr:two-component sensor histidine kinase [Culturomica sp.]